ncbi:uncharacterized protein LOC130714687 isoform X2 [Lotus japonicus]|uniref:uncharacterized protein LOC130714687 isoform X2 n=1 Tax=Lotus japonicus TaxID=34305 RepID=UPI00258A7799|nr:uncharacterized protein LOC130714687 isoform X2 [Lotus japonicus]
MAKTRSTGKRAKADEEQKNDGLEVISIGSLYTGPWDKKYWSSSRGKDRYPYPVGYEAVRVHNGTTYKMEIHEGVNGPKFLISSDDGSSSSGKTPEFAWEEFQKKGCPRNLHGKRLSSKMDGLELFGFKNPFIQRLLRELVADINGIAEQSLVSSNFCTKVSRMEDNDCCPNEGTYPDLLLSQGRSHVAGKRGRYEIQNKKVNGVAKPQFLEVTCTRASHVKYEKSLGQGSSTTHYDSEEENAVHNPIVVSPSLQTISSVDKRSNFSSSEKGLILNPIDISDDKKGGAVPSEIPTGFLYPANCNNTEITENLSAEKPLHRSHDELKMSSFLETSNKKLVNSCLEESRGCIDIDLCAPDTLDVQENTSDFSPSIVYKNGCEVTSEDLLNTEHEEVLKCNSNLGSEKSDFESAGQDVAKSMMSLLLPQAVPLLRNASTDKEFTIIPSDILPSRLNSMEKQIEVGYVLDVPASDAMVTEDAYGEQGEKVHVQNTELYSNTPITENMKSIVLDSFEYSQCEDLKTNLEFLSPDIAEVDRSKFKKEICTLRSQDKPPGCDLPNKSSSCDASELSVKHRPHNCDEFLETVLDIPLEDRLISERSNGACSVLKENPGHIGFDSTQNDLSSAQNCPAEKTQDGVVGKPGNAETMIMSSSQLPNLVYTRRKIRNTVRLQGNCSVVESTECDKIDIVTPEMHAGKGLLLDTSQIHVDVLGGPRNLVELNTTSSQNPNLFACQSLCSGAKEVGFISEPIPCGNPELKNNLSSNIKFVGCYLHPMPVLSIFLCTRGDEIHICVLCGLPMDQYRTLFTYKVNIKEPNLGRPSIMAHTSILLPDPKHKCIAENMVERSGVQLTPDGQHVILIGSIKTPSCRERKFDCYCATCTSVSTEKNALKIVRVEHGYVSVEATLIGDDNVHCILVCEPNRLVSVGESGRLQVWVMNSTWSKKMKCFIIPADSSISPGIVELKRVPKCAHLVVGHSISGEFSLWDIANLNCVSSISASKHPVNEFFPISLFDWQSKGSGFSCASIEEKADELLEATNLWHSDQRETFSFLPEEDVAMWLLVSTSSDLGYSHSHVSTSNHCDIPTARSWRLALLVKNSMVFGSPLDPRTTGMGVSGDYGIITTSDGVVYMCELSRGSKLYMLHRFQDGMKSLVKSNHRGKLWRSPMTVTVTHLCEQCEMAVLLALLPIIQEVLWEWPVVEANCCFIYTMVNRTQINKHICIIVSILDL